MFINENINDNCIHVFNDKDDVRNYARLNGYSHFITVEENHIKNYIKVKFER